jgi:thioesterase domain-containing protein/acyl carrier protein
MNDLDHRVSGGRAAATEVFGAAPGGEAQPPPRFAAAVAEIFSEALARESVGIDEDFLELGGDSFMAATIMATIHERYGVELSISELLQAPTPRQLAAVLDGANSRRADGALMEISFNGAPPPIFYVHGNAGESTLPVRLSNALGNRALFAFRAIGLNQGERPLSSIKDIASAYFAAILAKYPAGPLVVLGHCAGSVIAYEIAQLLSAAGREPSGLILIDPMAWDAQVHLHSSGLTRELKQASVRKQIATVENYLDTNPELSVQQRREIVKGLIEGAAAAYTPKPYPGRTLLFVTTSGASALLHPQRGYPALLPKMDVVKIDVRHEEMFRDLPAVARDINAFIETLQVVADPVAVGREENAIRW